jgi:hypothetical protein
LKSRDRALVAPGRGASLGNARGTTTSSRFPLTTARRPQSSPAFRSGARRMARFVLAEAARRGIEADKRAGADPRAVSAGPPRPCAVRSGAPHPRAVSAVSAGGPPHPRACSAGPPHPRAVTAVSAGGPAQPRAVGAGPSHPRAVRAGPPLPKRRPRLPTSSRRPRERRSRQRHSGSSSQRGPPDSGDPDPPSRLGAHVLERGRGRRSP